MTDCVYCGCATEAHDPVFVFEGATGDPTDADAFCNYACLAAHIEDADLTVGATCELDA